MNRMAFAGLLVLVACSGPRTRQEETLPPAPKESQAQPSQQGERYPYSTDGLAIRFWEAWLRAHPYEYVFVEGDGGPVFCGGSRGFVAYGSVRCVLRVLLGEEELKECGPDFTDDYGDVEVPFRKLSGTALLAPSRGLGFATFRRSAIRWAAEHLIPAPDARIMGRSAREIYAVTFAPSLRLHALVYMELTRRGIDAEAQAYKHDIVDGGADGMEWLTKRYGSMFPVKEPWAGRPGYLDPCTTVPYVAGFWLRRVLDGTASLIARYMFLFLKDYDPGFAQRAGIR